MKRIFVPALTGTDWQRLLGKPDLHWKKGRSAMSAAACYEESQSRLPDEVAQVLDSSDDPVLRQLELLAAFPEWGVERPGGETVSQTDILAIARNRLGLAIIGVEANVDEPFGPTLEEKKRAATAGQLSRIAFLEKELCRTTALEGHIRYQLLHRTVSAQLTARAFHASVAVMLIHSFSRNFRRRDDFEDFCQALDCRSKSPDLREVPGIEGPRLLLGWCAGNEKFLEVELPNAFKPVSPPSPCPLPGGAVDVSKTILL